MRTKVRQTNQVERLMICLRMILLFLYSLIKFRLLHVSFTFNKNFPHFHFIESIQSVRKPSPLLIPNTTQNSRQPVNQKPITIMATASNRYDICRAYFSSDGNTIHQSILLIDTANDSRGQLHRLKGHVSFFLQLESMNDYDFLNTASYKTHVVLLSVPHSFLATFEAVVQNTPIPNIPATTNHRLASENVSAAWTKAIVEEIHREPCEQGLDFS